MAGSFSSSKGEMSAGGRLGVERAGEEAGGRGQVEVVGQGRGQGTEVIGG